MACNGVTSMMTLMDMEHGVQSGISTHGMEQSSTPHSGPETGFPQPFVEVVLEILMDPRSPSRICGLAEASFRDQSQPNAPVRSRRQRLRPLHPKVLVALA